MIDLSNPPAALLRDLERRRRTDASGRTTFVDDAGYTILDYDTPGVPNADARAAAKYLMKVRPDLWEAETPPTTTTAPVAARTSPRP